LAASTAIPTSGVGEGIGVGLGGMGVSVGGTGLAVGERVAAAHPVNSNTSRHTAQTLCAVFVITSKARSRPVIFPRR